MVADGTSNVCALSTYVYVMIANHGGAKARSEYGPVLRNPDHDMILMPIHEPGHWTLVEIVIITIQDSYYLSQISFSGLNTH